MNKQIINTIGKWLVIIACLVTSIFFAAKGNNFIAYSFAIGGAGVFWIGMLSEL